MERKMVYFAHSRLEYGTLREKHILNIIRGRFCDHKVFNPGSVSNQRNFNRILTPGLSVKKYMRPFFNIIDDCVMLVFSALPGGKVGKGTYEEILYAFTQELPVYYIELPDNFVEITSDSVNRLHIESGKKGWAANYAIIEDGND